MTSKSRTAGAAALLLAALLTSAGTAQAAPPAPAPASIKVVFNADIGQKIWEVTDKAVGPGPELTPADKTQDVKLSYCGDPTVDIDPSAQTVTVSASPKGCYFDSATVRIQDTDLIQLQTVSDAFSTQGNVTITGQSGDWTLTWAGPKSYGTGTSSVFSFAPKAPSTTPPTPFVPGPLGLTTAEAPHLRGHKMSLDVDGFLPGEPYKVKISGVVVGHGTADATGQIHRKVRVPLRAHRPRAKLTVAGTQHRVSQLIRILNGIAKP